MLIDHGLQGSTSITPLSGSHKQVLHKCVGNKGKKILWCFLFNSALLAYMLGQMKRATKISSEMEDNRF